jgi:hypothetical protein
MFTFIFTQIHFRNPDFVRRRLNIKQVIKKNLGCNKQPRQIQQHKSILGCNKQPCQIEQQVGNVVSITKNNTTTMKIKN